MIYWCKKCKTPIFEKGLHSCSCDGKITKISESSICNPVFKQEKKLLEKIMDCSLGNEIIWYLGASKYLINEKIVKIPYREWYKQKKHLAIAEELRGDIEVERDYSPYMAVVSANEKYLNNIIYEAEQYIVQTLEKYKKDNYIPTVSFSGGKDSSVVSRLVMDALQDNTVIHMFGDTTLEFHETYIYVNEKFRRENPRVPMIPSETENDFFKMCKVFGPPSQYERWCCTIFKTSNLNKEYENLPGNSLTFLGIRHSESVARARYDRTQEISKISSQVNAMPIIEWKDYDVWLYILAKNLLINDCYQYGYKRVGCWCCPNNSDWSMMLTEIYHPDDMQRWKNMVSIKSIALLYMNLILPTSVVVRMVTASFTAASTAHQKEVILGLALRQESTRGCNSSSVSPISKAPIDLRAPTDPPYPRASSAILPFCLRCELTPCFSTGTPNIWLAEAQ